MIQMNLLTKQEDSQIQKTNAWSPKGQGQGEGKGVTWNLGLTNTYYYTKIDRQQGPIASHRGLYSIFCNYL